MAMYTIISVLASDCVTKEIVLKDVFYNNFIVPKLSEFQKKLIARGGSITIYAEDESGNNYSLCIRERKYGKDKRKPTMGRDWREFVVANELDENCLLLVVWRIDGSLTLKVVVRGRPENCCELLGILEVCFPVPRRRRSIRKRKMQKEIDAASRSVNQNRRQLVPDLGECSTKNINVIPNEHALARKVAEIFFLDLMSGNLDLGPSANANKSGHTTEPNTDETCVRGKKRWRRQFSEESAAPKAPTLCSEPKRIQCDIELALKLVTKLDSEKGIGDDLLSKYATDKINKERAPSESVGPVTTKYLLTSVKDLKGTELLDTLLTYLWRVHGIDYYGMVETVEPKGLRHVRDEGKNSDDSNQALEWEKKLDSRWQDRICRVDPLEAMTEKEKIDAATSEALKPFVSKIKSGKHGWKYGCKAKGCSKFFVAPDFVMEHLKIAHSELVMELTSKVLEDISSQNYMNDPDDPGGGQPILQ